MISNLSFAAVPPYIPSPKGRGFTAVLIKKLHALRYAEEVTIQGKTYTYIRIYTVDEVNASILPGAKGALESNSEPVNRETLRLIIDAARRAAHE